MRKTNTNTLQASIGNKHLSPSKINRIIDTAMEKLSEDDHKILYALYFRNLSLRQLSIRLKLPYSTVRYKELKALSNLKEIITNLLK